MQSEQSNHARSLSGPEKLLTALPLLACLAMVIFRLSRQGNLDLMAILTVLLVAFGVAFTRLSDKVERGGKAAIILSVLCGLIALWFLVNDALGTRVYTDVFTWLNLVSNLLPVLLFAFLTAWLILGGLHHLQSAVLLSLASLVFYLVASVFFLARLGQLLGGFAGQMDLLLYILLGNLAHIFLYVLLSWFTWTRMKKEQAKLMGK